MSKQTNKLNIFFNYFFNKTITGTVNLKNGNKRKSFQRIIYLFSMMIDGSVTIG